MNKRESQEISLSGLDISYRIKNGGNTYVVKTNEATQHAYSSVIVGRLSLDRMIGLENYKVWAPSLSLRGLFNTTKKQKETFEQIFFIENIILNRQDFNLFVSRINQKLKAKKAHREVPYDEALKIFWPLHEYYTSIRQKQSPDKDKEKLLSHP